MRGGCAASEQAVDEKADPMATFVEIATVGYRQSATATYLSERTN